MMRNTHGVLFPTHRFQCIKKIVFFYYSKDYTPVLLVFGRGKGTANARNFTFSDVEAIGVYVLYKPIKAGENKYSNKDLKSGITVSFFFHANRKNIAAKLHIRTDCGASLM